MFVCKCFFAITLKQHLAHKRALRESLPRPSSLTLVLFSCDSASTSKLFFHFAQFNSSQLFIELAAEDPLHVLITCSRILCPRCLFYDLFCWFVVFFLSPFFVTVSFSLFKVQYVFDLRCCVLLCFVAIVVVIESERVVVCSIVLFYFGLASVNWACLWNGNISRTCCFLLNFL